MSTAEVDVAPLQCEQLAHPQARERGRLEQCGVLLGGGRPNEREDLSGENASMSSEIR